jgi:hypothetical protein
MDPGIHKLAVDGDQQLASHLAALPFGKEAAGTARAGSEVGLDPVVESNPSASIGNRTPILQLYVP